MGTKANSTSNNNLETILIDNILYLVESAKTPENCKDSLPNLAAHMVEHKQARQLYLRRPNGKRHYFAIQGLNGAYSSVTVLR
jgi:hypothetical protein